MTRWIVGIDPGNNESGFVIYDQKTKCVFDAVSEIPNVDLLKRFREGSFGPDKKSDTVFVVETFQPRGQPLYWQLIWTAIFTGRLFESAEARGWKTDLLYREQAKLTVTGRLAGSDSNVRAALIDRFGGSSAVGTKKDPGPLYGVHGHAWSALAIAIAYSDGARSKPPIDKPKRQKRSAGESVGN